MKSGETAAKPFHDFLFILLANDVSGGFNVFFFIEYTAIFSVVISKKFIIDEMFTR